MIDTQDLMSCSHQVCACVQLAPMSTTTDFTTAAEYSIGNSGQSLIFSIVTKHSLQRGADLQWISAFPTEAEVLYPPLTYLEPTGRTQVIPVKTYICTIVQVNATIP